MMTNTGTQWTFQNLAAQCAKGDIDNAAYDSSKGGCTCAGCGRWFGGNGMRAFNAHVRAAKRAASGNPL